MAIIGGRYYKDEEIRFPYQWTDLLSVASSGGTDTIPGQGAAEVIQVLGYHIIEFERDTMTLLTSAKLEFATTGRIIWSGIPDESSRKENHISDIMGIRVKGGADEALTLTNATYGAGLAKIHAVIYFEIIDA